MAYLESGSLFELPERNEYLQSSNAFFASCLAQAQRNRYDYTLSHSEEERRQALRAMLGFPLCPSPEKNDIRVKQRLLVEADRFKAYSMQLEIIEGVWFYGILLEPAAKKEKNALVIVQHGGLGISEMVSGLIPPTNYHDLAQNILSDGVYVFCPQLFHWSVENWGTAYNGSHMDGLLRMLGGSKTAYGVYGIERVLDYFSARSDIDPERIGMAGLSYGGMYTLVTAALDTRIRFAMSSCFVNDRTKYTWSDWCYPGQAERFLDAEIITLISPRPFMAEAGSRDHLFNPEGFRSVADDVKKYQEAMSMPDTCRFHVFEGTHEFGTDGENLRFIKQFL